MTRETTRQPAGDAYQIGRSVARLPLWVKALVIVSVGGSLYRCVTTPVDSTPYQAPTGVTGAVQTTPEGLAAARARTNAAVEAQHRAAEAKRLECETSLPAQKGEYEALFKQGKYWDAAGIIRKRSAIHVLDGRWH
jgi:hypothetical protein